MLVLFPTDEKMNTWSFLSIPELSDRELSFVSGGRGRGVRARPLSPEPSPGWWWTHSACAGCEKKSGQQRDRGAGRHLRTSAPSGAALPRGGSSGRGDGPCPKQQVGHQWVFFFTGSHSLHFLLGCSSICKEFMISAIWLPIMNSRLRGCSEEAVVTKLCHHLRKYYSTSSFSKLNLNAYCDTWRPYAEHTDQL